jgi:hypothetical protein
LSKIQFENYNYYPTLRTRGAEILGLEKLSDENKKKILPIITLGKWHRSDDIKTSMNKTIESVNGNQFIVDVTQEVKHHCESSLDLLSHQQNFKKWIDFCSQYEKIIPTVQITELAKLRDIVMQAKILESQYGYIAFRIKNIHTDVNRVISSLVALDKPQNAIIFIDLGYIRESFPAAVIATINAINQIRTEIPEAIISILTTSFPSSVIRFCHENKQSGFIDVMERDFHQSIGGQSVAIYGDHGSIHSVVYDDVMGRYIPRIDIALDDAWYFERRPDSKDANGYIDAAKSILKEYPSYESDPSWGAEMIRNAASGNVTGMGSPAKWIAVRVNLHLSKQIERCEMDNYDAYDLDII